jgi:hypothetical protein
VAGLSSSIVVAIRLWLVQYKTSTGNPPYSFPSYSLPGESRWRAISRLVGSPTSVSCGPRELDQRGVGELRAFLLQSLRNCLSRR